MCCLFSINYGYTRNACGRMLLQTTSFTNMKIFGDRRSNQISSYEIKTVFSRRKNAHVHFAAVYQSVEAQHRRNYYVIGLSILN